MSELPQFQSPWSNDVSAYRAVRDRMTELEQKGVKRDDAAEVRSFGQAFVESAEFKSVAAGQLQKGRVEVKNTLLSNATTVLPQQVRDFEARVQRHQQHRQRGKQQQPR